MIGARLVIVLAGQEPSEMRRRAALVETLPDGAHVVLRVGSSRPEPSAVWHLAEHESRLLLDLEGSGVACRDWSWAIRTSNGAVGR